MRVAALVVGVVILLLAAPDRLAVHVVRDGDGAGAPVGDRHAGQRAEAVIGEARREGLAVRDVGIVHDRGLQRAVEPGEGVGRRGVGRVVAIAVFGVGRGRGDDRAQRIADMFPHTRALTDISSVYYLYL